MQLWVITSPIISEPQRKGAGVVGGTPVPPPTISWSKYFFPHKIGKDQISSREEHVRL